MTQPAPAPTGFRVQDHSAGHCAHAESHGDQSAG
jgi:hypothetical protein